MLNMSEMSIFDWACAYIKYKDSVQGKIQTLDSNEKKGEIKVNLKDGSKNVYLCTNLLGDLNVENLNDEKVVCLNKKENLNWLIANWEALKDKKCVFLFVNPKRSENWAINPRMHHSITDKSALKPGLKVLFESIPEAN